MKIEQLTLIFIMTEENLVHIVQLNAAGAYCDLRWLHQILSNVSNRTVRP